MCMIVSSTCIKPTALGEPVSCRTWPGIWVVINFPSLLEVPIRRFLSWIDDELPSSVITNVRATPGTLIRWYQVSLTLHAPWSKGKWLSCDLHFRRFFLLKRQRAGACSEEGPDNQGASPIIVQKYVTLKGSISNKAPSNSKSVLNPRDRFGQVTGA